MTVQTVNEEPSTHSQSTSEQYATVTVDAGGKPHLDNNRSRGAASAGGGAGDYTVTFDELVNEAVFIATLGVSNNQVQPGEIVVTADAPGMDKSVRIFTFNSAGAAAPRGFQLYVRSNPNRND